MEGAISSNPSMNCNCEDFGLTLLEAALQKSGGKVGEVCVHNHSYPLFSSQTSGRPTTLENNAEKLQPTETFINCRNST